MEDCFPNSLKNEKLNGVLVINFDGLQDSKISAVLGQFAAKVDCLSPFNTSMERKEMHGNKFASLD